MRILPTSPPPPTSPPNLPPSSHLPPTSQSPPTPPSLLLPPPSPLPPLLPSPPPSLHDSRMTHGAFPWQTFHFAAVSPSLLHGLPLCILLPSGRFRALFVLLSSERISFLGTIPIPVAKLFSTCTIPRFQWPQRMEVLATTDSATTNSTMEAWRNCFQLVQGFRRCRSTTPEQASLCPSLQNSRAGPGVCVLRTIQNSRAGPGGVCVLRTVAVLSTAVRAATKCRPQIFVFSMFSRRGRRGVHLVWRVFFGFFPRDVDWWHDEIPPIIPVAKLFSTCTTTSTNFLFSTSTTTVFSHVRKLQQLPNVDQDVVA